MLRYDTHLKSRARRLRRDMMDAERRLWSRLRRKQILGVPFYRQKPIGDYIVDFYAPRSKLVVEVDGSQHVDAECISKDARRDAYLESCGLRVLRFNDLQVLQEIGAVMEVIFGSVKEVLED